MVFGSPDNRLPTTDNRKDFTMNAKRYESTPVVDATAQKERGRWTLVFPRVLPHPPERVWQALTDPAVLREWAPFDSDRNLGQTGDATLVMAGGAGGDAEEAMPAKVLVADAPRLLEYTWSHDVLRWELARESNGTRLTLRHTVEDASWLAKVAAGWHICLDIADAWLSGQPIGRIVGPDARPWWEPLNEAYAKLLNVKLLKAEQTAKT